MRIYILGPMTGLQEYNYPAFNAMAAKLRALGHEVENPAENDIPIGSPWIDFMRSAIPRLISCEAVVALNGWGESRGAGIEYSIAEGLGFSIYSEAYIDAGIDLK